MQERNTEIIFSLCSVFYLAARLKLKEKLMAKLNEGKNNQRV